jgi:putative transposase
VLFRFWSRWKDTIVIVKPETAIRWHRKGFRLYWRAISKPGPGRPPISEELKALICRLANESKKRHAPPQICQFFYGRQSYL